MNTPFVIERVYNASAEQVWRAITEKDLMKRWYFDLDRFKPEVGFEFHFEGGAPDGERYLHNCKVMEAIPNKKLKYSWSYEGYEGISYVTFEILPEGNKAKLRLTHEGLETFPKIEAFARHNFEMGWTELIGTSLKKFLEE
jgi:uncharacterized protein YndB with AHSA1/START domain